MRDNRSCIQDAPGFQRQSARLSIHPRMPLFDLLKSVYALPTEERLGYPAEKKHHESFTENADHSAAHSPVTAKGNTDSLFIFATHLEALFYRQKNLSRKKTSK